MKKILSMILALAMVFSLAVPAAAADVTGDTEGDVTANYTPVITITDIALSEYEGNDSVTADAVNKIYTITIPADADSTVVTVTVSGQNLDKITEGDYKVSFLRDIYDPLIADSCDPNTGTMSWSLNVYAINAGTDLQYSTDGGKTWTDTGWSTVVRKEYNVTVNAAENGTVTASSATAAEGETVELFVTAAEGYELDSLTVKQGETAVEVAEDHTFTMPAGDVTVTATFKAAVKAYNITINESENGTVVAMVGEQQVTSAHHNDDVTLVVTPAEGYRLGSLTVKDASNNDVTITDSNTFTMPAANVTVTAVFEKVYTVTASAEGAGTVHVDKEFVAEGETVTVTFTANDGYVLFDQYANNPNNSSDYVELIPGTEANTYTFQMPAFDVHVVGYIVKDGRARDDLYFNNGGNTAWTDVTASFYTETGNYIDTVSLTMAEDGIYTLPKDTEIPNLAYEVYFNNGTDTTAIVAIPTDDNNMFTLGTTTNEYGQYEGTWSVYTPSQPPAGTTSAEIVWGSLSFTYTDGEDGAEGAWSCEDGANKITVTNTGDNAFNAQPLYDAKEGYTEIEGVFYESMEATVNTMYADLYSGDSFTFYLKLKNQPSKALNGETIATVTIRITEGIGE